LLRSVEEARGENVDVLEERVGQDADLKAGIRTKKDVSEES